MNKLKNTSKLNIDYISDLHSSFYLKKEKSLFWKDWILKNKPNSDYLIIAWDINDNKEELKRTLNDIIENTNYKKIIITLWNHDLYLNQNDILSYLDEEKNEVKTRNFEDSMEKYVILINELHWYKDKIHVIDFEDFIIEENRVAITWNMGWYNYTGVNDVDKYYLEKYYKADFEKMSFANFTSNDRNFIKFSEDICSNYKFSEFLERDLARRLKNIKKNPKTKDYKIVAISHIKPSREIEKDSKFNLSYSPDQWKEIIKDWDSGILKYNLWIIYWNAYYTNNNLHKIYKQYWVDYWIYWHTHISNTYDYEGIKYLTNCLWYYWIEEISNEIKTLEIN